MAQINIYHLYPEHLNLYGDRGNILALCRRAAWHGLAVNLVPVQPGEAIEFGASDLLFMGGGQDIEQKMVAADLKKRRHEMLPAIEAGMVILAICGSYQLFGHYYTTLQGERIPGLEIIDLYTEAGHKRITGNIVVRCGLWDPPRTLVGFETTPGAPSWGKVCSPWAGSPRPRQQRQRQNRRRDLPPRDRHLHARLPFAEKPLAHRLSAGQSARLPRPVFCL